MFAFDIAPGSSRAPRSLCSPGGALARRRTFSSSRIKRTDPPSLTRRRSVRSMKRLLPLTLPSNSQNIRHPSTAFSCLVCIRGGTMAVVEPASPIMDSVSVPAMDAGAAAAAACNFPEMLARDLECSSLVFAARELTAGAPSRELAYGNGQWHQPQREPASLPPFSASSTPSNPLDSPTQLPVVRFERIRNTPHLPSTNAATRERSNSDSDVASISSGHSFSELEPASVRQHSVITAATSITGGGRRSAASQKGDHSPCHTTNASWIDLEPDADGDVEPTEPKTIQLTVTGSPGSDRREATAKRPPSPQRASSANAATHRPPNPFTDLPGSGPVDRTWSLQAYPIPPSEDWRRRSLQCIEISVPQRRSSLRNLDAYATLEPPAPSRATFKESTRAPMPPRSSSPSPRPVARPEEPEEREDTGERASPLGSPFDEDLKDEIEPWFRYLDEQYGSPEGPKRYSAMKHRSLLSRPTSPIDEVQQWLETSIDASPADEYQSRRIPLPPDVVETLRVSITCFPETMLLCSSLSIETIRSYARKMKHPADEPVHLQTPPPSPKKWKWSAVLGQRRSASSLKREYANQRYFSSELRSASAELPPAIMTPSVPQPQWSRLRNIFPQGSDYLLDALFAHLVAYSYVSGLLPRLPPGPSPPRSERCSSDSAYHPLRESRDSSNDIPRKAWKMLGLEDMETGGHTPSLRASVAPLSPQQQHQQQQRTVRKKPSFMDSMRPSRLQPLTQTGLAEQASMRELQIGLARCIGKLVSTLRAGPDEGDELPMLAGECPKAGEIDPLLVRTLCEIVRCCEAV
ncbi:hypothetical protein ACRALDRAFT_2032524 [Sodiomyces alcalophilus JCM 7366]|uniref:uncharacterized protein n=1 Tax=Sodiomyces alcalophilus JCM 7366 TaxID=591952 RepID=UPI0039B650BA